MASASVAARPNLVFGSNYGEDVNPSRWVVIYTPYLDSSRTEKEGRKIAKEKCVDKPTMTEVFDCAQLLGFQTALELDKAYCRDYWARGRVRVRLFDADGRPTSTEITNRRTLYARVAALIPEHRQRIAAAAAAKGATAKGGAAKKGAGNAAGKGGKDGKAGAGGKSGGKGGVKVTVAPKKKKKGKR